MSTNNKYSNHPEIIPFHPGEDRRREGIYIAFDAAENFGTEKNTMYCKKVANMTLVTIISMELLVFYVWFGVWGLLAFAISTIVYTLIDKRAREWVVGLLRSNSAD